LNVARLARTLLILALAASIGLHWMLLQSVAWVGMFADFSRDNSLRTAVTMTFDGNHPCPLCLAVKAGDDTTKQPGKPPLFKAKDLTCLALNDSTTSLPPIPTAQADKPFPAPAQMPSARSDTPPLPPPRHQV